MNFKKTMSSVLSGAIVFTSLAFFNPVKANETNKEYFEELKKVSTWEKIESDSKLEAKIDIKESSLNASFGYDIELKSNYDQKEMKGYLMMNFKQKTSETPFVPNLTIYIDKDSLYINKEAFNHFSKYLDLDKEITKDFVKITGLNNSQYPSTLGFNSEFLKSYSQNSSQITEKLIKFIQGIDLGVDLGLIKKNDVYSITWESDKIVDIINGYIKFVFKNPDYIFDFYKDVLGIDLFAFYKEMGLENINKEEIKKSMAEAYDMWIKEIEPMLPKIKEIIKGSKITFTQTYKENQYKSDTSILINVDLLKAEKLFYNAKTENKDKSSIVLVLNSNETDTKNPNLKISMPTSYEEFDFNKYIQDEEKKLEKELELSTPDDTKKSEDMVEFTISPSKKTLIANEFGDISEREIDCKVENGKLYVSKSDIENMLLDVLDTNEEYLPFKMLMEEHGYKIKWDSKKHVVVATKKF